MILSGSSAWFGSSLTFIDTKSIEQTSIMLCLFFFLFSGRTRVDGKEFFRQVR